MSHPNEVSLEQLITTPIGGQYNAGGCVVKLGAKSTLNNCVDSGLKWPDNGEFAFGGQGADCKVCNTDNGLDYTGRSCSWYQVSYTGGNCTVTRTAYRGDPTRCCLNGGAALDGSTTCDPQFRDGPNAPVCNSVFSNYCSQGDRIFTNPQCLTWANRNNDSANAIKENYCIGNPTSDKCNAWGNMPANNARWNGILQKYCSDQNNLGTPFCKTNMRNIGGIDDAVSTWCAAHPTDPFCSCTVGITQIPEYQNASQSIRRFLTNPKCYYNTCLNQGYLTTVQRNNPCPSCINSIDVSGAVGGNIDNIAQSCNQSASTSTSTSTSSSTSSSDSSIVSTSITKITEASNDKLLLLLFIVINCIFIAILISSGGESKANVNEPKANSL